MQLSPSAPMGVSSVVVLICILCVVIPAAADEYTIPSGGTVFIGEENLDITASGATAGASLVWYGPGGKISNAPAAQVTVADPQNFYVSSVVFGGKTGPWFLLPANSVAFYVQEPTLDIRVVDYSSGFIVSPSASWIPKGDTAGFRIETNMWVMAQRPDCAGAPMSIRLTGPGNVKYSSLGGYSLQDIFVSSTPFETGPVWNTGSAEYPSGNYTVYLDTDPKDSQKVTFLIQKDNPLIKPTTAVPATSIPPATATQSQSPTVLQSPVPTDQTPIATQQETTFTTLPTTIPPTRTPGFGVLLIIGAIMFALFLVARDRN